MFDDVGVVSWVGISKFSLNNTERIFNVSVKKLKMDKSNSVGLCFFVPSIVMQLCNVNRQMRAFQINVLMQFVLSSTCFEHHVFIIRKAICTCSFYGMFLCIYVSL